MKLESFIAASKAVKFSVAKCSLLFVIALALVMPGYNAANAQDEVVAKFSGDGTANTRPFTVAGPWKIQFDNMSNHSFSIDLYGANGDLKSVAVSKPGRGTGSSYQPAAGTYFLGVDADGKWTVTVVRVK